MLSASFVQKRLALNESGEAITQIAWNRTDGWLAYAGEQGMMKIVMIETVDTHDFNLQGIAARPSRISIEKKVSIHEGQKVTSLNWNEANEQITSGDVRGSVVVCEYKDSKWSSILVNESVQSPVTNAVWASDASKILIFYQSGQVLLGAASGHKILSVQIKQADIPKFAYVSDSRFDFFVVGFEGRVICYNFDASEKFKVQFPNDKLIAGCLVEYKEKEEPKIVVVLQSGQLQIFSAVTGVRIGQQQLQSVTPNNVSTSPNGQYIAVSGTAQEAQRIDSSNGIIANQEHLAVVKLIRFCDMEQVAQIRIPSRTATCVAWDASSLRLAVGTDNSLFLCCLRLSYRHYMLRDQTIAFSTGSTIVKSSSQIVKSQQKDECIMFLKSNSMHRRWPQQFIDQCSCGEYLAMAVGRQVSKSDGTTRQLSSIIFHSSVGAPIMSIDLSFVPFYISGSDHYLVCANSARISLFDIRFLSGETKDYQNTMETKLDAGQAYSGLVEWHADSSPFAPDRELHVVKTSVSSAISCVSCSNQALFIGRANGVVQRFNLPSLQSNIRVQTGVQLKALKCNCTGTAIAGVTDDGFLQIFYTEDFVDQETIVKKIEKKEEKKKEEKILVQQEAADDLSKMLGLDGEIKVDKQKQQVITKDQPMTKVFAPWDPKIGDIWGLEWNNEDPNLLAVSSRHTIYVLQVEKKSKEEPITSSAHLLAFKGLHLHGVYLDEIVMYGEPKEGSICIFETQQLRELKTILFGGSVDDDVNKEQPKAINLITMFSQEQYQESDIRPTTNLTQALQYLKAQNASHPQLFKMVAEAALRELAIDIASQLFIRAGDYVSYHFAEHIRKIGQDELRKAEIAVFLGDFRIAEQILIKQLGRPELSVRNDEQLGCWFKIIAQHKDNEYNPVSAVQISDELATMAYKQAGLYYLRQRDYIQAVTMLQSAKDVNLLAEAYFRAEMYDDLRQLATTLSVEVHADAIVATSKVLARIGDVEGATKALLRLNKQEEAIRTCISLKRFDQAIIIAQEFNMLDVVDKHLSEYLKQLLSQGDDKAALDLLRKTNQGEIAACIIIGAAMEELKEALATRALPIKPGVFNRLRRLVVLAAKEATEVQKRTLTKELKSQQQTGAALLTVASADQTLQNLMTDQQPEEKQQIMDNQLFSKFGNKIKSVSMIWKIVKQTRFIVLASYMLYLNKPEQALYPAIEASGFYQKLIHSVGNIQNVVDEEYKCLQKIALPIAVYAALQVQDFDLASQLLEVFESDDSLPIIERDQLEQLAVDIFSRFPPVESTTVAKECQLQCEKCKTMMPKYCTICTCGWTAQLCSRTGQPISNKAKSQRCSVCQCTSMIGKAPLGACPMCHDVFM